MSKKKNRAKTLYIVSGLSNKLRNINIANSNREYDYDMPYCEQFASKPGMRKERNIQ